MYGQTKVGYGFNHNELLALLKLIEQAYEFETSSMDGLFYCFQNAILGVDYADLTGGATGGWYAPEAKAFCEKVLTPATQEAYKKTYDLYKSIHDSITGAGNSWRAATGSTTVKHPWPFAYQANEAHFITVPDNKNGNIVIDPNIANHIAQSYKKCKEGYESNYSNMIKKIIQNAAFLGGDQQRQLVEKISRVHKGVVTSANNVYTEALEKIAAAVEKYKNLANQIANNFGSVNRVN